MNLYETAYLIAHDAMGSRLRAAHREYCSLGKMSRAGLETLRAQRLSDLLRHAVQNVPFYRERVTEAAPTLAAFPILKKDALRTNYRDFMEPSLREEHEGCKKRARYSWVEVKTGGSTGTPTSVIHDADFRDWGRAGRLYSQAMCGFPIGTPYFYLWGSMRDINDSRDSLQKRVMNGLLRMHPMNAFLMDAARMDEYLRQMHETQLCHLMAYIDAAAELARHVERTGQAAPKLQSVMACAGTVLPSHRELLGKVFGARVHNKYGSRECADMACECASGGFHIFENAVHIEIVDKDGQPVPEGVTGRILVTLLMNKRFPLIRYEIGDMGSRESGSCGCGSPLGLLKELEGRSVEFLINTTGGYVSPVYIRHIIGVVHGGSALQRFQLVQEEAESFSLVVQMDAALGEQFFGDWMGRLRPDLLKVLGEDAEIRIERADRIEASESGKFLYVKNLCSRR